MLRQCEDDDIEAFLSASDDRFVRCEDFAAWRRGELLGIDVWGDASPSRIERRARVLDHFSLPGARKQGVLFDVSTCRDSSPMMYVAAVEFWRTRRERHAAAFDKLAVVVRSGYVGALVAGLALLLPKPGYAIRIFETREAALAWLGEANASSLDAELRILRRSTGNDAAVLERLQQLLAGHDLSLEVIEAARQLGMSSRTLQRRLSTAGTTFQAELLRAKLSRAARLMLTGQFTMTAIAFDLGFASPQHFSSRFAAVYGEPPSSWLRNYRAAEGDHQSVG